MSLRTGLTLDFAGPIGSRTIASDGQAKSNYEFSAKKEDEHIAHNLGGKDSEGSL